MKASSTKKEQVKKIELEFTGQNASHVIREKLLSPEPCMIARFGNNELKIVLEYQNSYQQWKYIKYVTGKITTYKINESTFQSAYNNAGIFPSNEETLGKFAKLMLEDMKEIDVLGSWIPGETFFKDEIKNAVKIRLKDIEPYYHLDPWSSALQGLKILVIHPFSRSIEEQYKKREFLFQNQQVLPLFELNTIQAVQSIAGQSTSFTDWFEALDHMKDQIKKVDFDIAIIGCGAYGFPLAAFVKRLGKKSVHMGGATQVLFGIKGTRWLEHEYISSLFNEHWKFPKRNETPKNFENVENGCYW